MFGCYTWKDCFFSEGKGGGVMLDKMGGEGEESGREEGMENSSWDVIYKRRINNFFQKEIYSPLS